MVEDKGEMSIGVVSDWNEGNLKSLRLHQAQILINTSKADPFGRNMNKWNYELWFAGSDIVFGEGVQKYSDKEKDQAMKLKREIEELISRGFNNPFITQINSNSHKGINIDMNKWKPLKEKLEEFEFLVKKLNDQHGLSTRNVKSSGLF